MNFPWQFKCCRVMVLIFSCLIWWGNGWVGELSWFTFNLLLLNSDTMVIIFAVRELRMDNKIYCCLLSFVFLCTLQSPFPPPSFTLQSFILFFLNPYMLADPYSGSFFLSLLLFLLLRTYSPTLLFSSRSAVTFTLSLPSPLGGRCWRPSSTH